MCVNTSTLMFLCIFALCCVLNVFSIGIWMCSAGCECGHMSTRIWMWRPEDISSLRPPWNLGIKLRSLGLQGKCLYLLRHLTDFFKV